MYSDRTCVVRVCFSSRPSTGRRSRSTGRWGPVWHALCFKNWADQYKLGEAPFGPSALLSPWNTGPGDHRVVGMTSKGRTEPLRKGVFSRPVVLFATKNLDRGSFVTHASLRGSPPSWKTSLTRAERRQSSWILEGRVSPRSISNFHGFDATSSGHWFLKLISEANSDTFVFMKSTPPDHHIR